MDVELILCPLLILHECTMYLSVSVTVWDTVTDL